MTTQEQAQQRSATEQKIALFERQFGVKYRLLAYHAALPLVLTPELVHYLRTEFLGDEVPWEAEADLLLSDLCSQVGYELYAMDSDVRACLLEQMRLDEAVPQDRMKRVAQLLISYINYLGHINPGQRERELQAQRWAAMAYMGDESCLQMVMEITAQFEASGGQGSSNSVKAEFARLARITQELAQQLELYPELLEFARQVNRSLREPESLTAAERRRKYVVGDRILQLPGREDESSFPALETFNFVDAKFTDASVEVDPSFPPPLKTEDFTVITLQLEPDTPQTLQPFEFDVATLHKVDNRWDIQRQFHRAYHYIEVLALGLNLEMVSIPAGTFRMGSPADEPDRYDNESPQHEVQVESFFMGRYPITQAQWRVVAAMPKVAQELDPDPSKFKGDNRPVEQVPWFDAIEFCERLSKYTGRLYRLPAEAEWEYACRAGTITPFHFGNTVTSELANFNGEFTYNGGPTGKYRQKTTSVDHFGLGNAFGLSDMHGNVFEWCQDLWHSNYEKAPMDGTAWLTEEKSAIRVLRGGSWYGSPRHCRSAYRSYNNPDDRYNFIGFRVVCSAPRALLRP